MDKNKIKQTLDIVIGELNDRNQKIKDIKLKLDEIQRENDRLIYHVQSISLELLNSTENEK